MNLSLLSLGLFGFLRLATATFVAGWVSSPMSWSPDGEWLSYSVATSGEPGPFRPGWIFVTADEVSESPGAGAPASRPSIYRIWATHRGSQPSVLIEESQWPLTAPAWSPRGRSIAFGRFVPQSIEATQSVQKGRYEVVIQDGLDQKRVVWSSPDFELSPTARTGLSHLSCSWSPDGLYLAIPRPGQHSSIEMVRTDTKKRVHVLDNAGLPAWSPDGSKCAYIRHDHTSNRLEYVERLGQGFSESRVIAANGVVLSAPHWSSDNRSIIAIVERATARSLDLEIMRFMLEPNEQFRLMPMAPDPMRRGGTIHGLAIDFDREGERCFFAVDVEGRDHDMVWSIPREKLTHKRFHPLDISQRIEGLAASPDGQVVAVRFGSSGGLTPPALYDSETEQTTLLVPDDDARKDWLRVLAGTATRLLKAALPPAVVEGQAARRPTLLPLPGELSPLEVVVARLSKLAQFGSTLCLNPAGIVENGERQPTCSIDNEARLFFHYLRGDYQAAAADLENLEPSASTPRERLSLLSVRAQLLWLRGEKSEAGAVIDYLASCEEPNRRLVEDTPLGLVFAPIISSQQAWSRYMAARVADQAQLKSVPRGELPADVIDPRLQDPFPLPEMPLIERGGAAPIPFSPQVGRRDVR
jgi:Tol biopolymer transport system component